jgi:ABC-type phosphate transport system substrate-binding protein
VFSADVVHKAPTNETLDAYDIHKLTDIFTRKLIRWEADGGKITVFVYPLNSITHKAFVFEWLGLTNYRYKKMLQQNTFSGYASSVRIVSSDEQMMLTITTTPNSIGYISNYMVFNNDSKISIISID